MTDAPAFLRGARFAAIGPTCPHCVEGVPVQEIGSVRRHLVGDPLAEGASFVLCTKDVDERETRRRDNAVICLALAAAVGLVVGLWRALGGRPWTTSFVLGAYACGAVAVLVIGFLIRRPVIGDGRPVPLWAIALYAAAWPCFAAWVLAELWRDAR